MSERSAPLRRSDLEAGLALGLASATAAIIAASSWADSEFAARLAITAVVVFALALVLGSARLAGVATVPILAAALLASASTDGGGWVRSIAVGCLWYAATELGWDAIERRDGAERSAALDLRRVHEVATVVTISLIATIAGFAASTVAPERTFLLRGFVAIVALAVLGVDSACSGANGWRFLLRSPSS